MRWGRPGPATEARACQKSPSEALVFAQVAPLAHRQLAQDDAADAHPLQLGDDEVDGLAHATDLALAALAQHEAQLVLVGPADLGRAQLLAVQPQAVAQALEVVVGKL